MDAIGTLWMIDFATAELGHSLQDLAKLLCSSLLFYLPVGDETFELALPMMCLARRRPSARGYRNNFASWYR